MVTLTLLPQKLLSLNLPYNGLYQLDGLSNIIQMVPRVKILNLSKDEVIRGSHIRAGFQVGGGTQQSGDRSQEKVPVREGGGQWVSLFLWDSFSSVLHIFPSKSPPGSWER